MTTLITRLYSDVEQAHSVVEALVTGRHNAKYVTIIEQDDGSDITERMRAAGVGPAARAAYGDAMTDGNALMVMAAPFGTSVQASRIMDRFASIKVDLTNEAEHVSTGTGPSKSSTILTSHPLIMSNPFRGPMIGYILSTNPVIKGDRKVSAIRGGAHMSTKILPLKLLKKRKEKTSAISGGFLFSSKIGMPTLLRS